MVKTSNAIHSAQIGGRRLKLARRALDLIEQYTWVLRLNHRRLDQITALAERLKFEVQNLEREAVESM
jgi:hypothetical protein